MISEEELRFRLLPLVRFGMAVCSHGASGLDFTRHKLSELSQELIESTWNLILFQSMNSNGLKLASFLKENKQFYLDHLDDESRQSHQDGFEAIAYIESDEFQLNDEG